ncbi:MAG: hypothetical protein H6631_06180 [Anaerolineaceae bacterium]|nr:hypothetical protein [Anaerolineaceae bacterium]MCB9100341.1 hypothetical protein [Anaerolineales bacterium]
MMTEGRTVTKHLTGIVEADQGLLIVFDEVYNDVTDSIINMINEGKFDNPEAMIWVIEEFDRYYREAKQAYFEPQGQVLAPVWAKVFELIGAGKPASRQVWRVSVLEALVLPIIVHMVHDLPLAVANNLITQPKALQTNLQDYDRINKQLWVGLNDVQSRVLAKYSPALIVLSKICGDMDELILYHLIKLLRGATWYDAIRLFDIRRKEVELGRAIKTVLTGDPLDKRIKHYTGQLDQASKRYREVRSSIEIRTNYYLDFVQNPPWLFLIVKLIFLSLRLCDGLFLTLADLLNRPSPSPHLAEVHQSELVF